MKDVSEERYRYIFENANEAIVVVQDSRLLLFNPEFLKLSGYSEEEIKDRPFAEFIHKDDSEKVSDYYQKRLGGAEVPEVYPFRIVAKNREIKWVEFHVVGIDWEGKPAILAFLFDITERKELEKERERLITELQEALSNVKTLGGLLPICAWCKKIRDDTGYWDEVEHYISEHSDAEFTHGMCTGCLEKYLKENELS